MRTGTLHDIAARVKTFWSLLTFRMPPRTNLAAPNARPSTLNRLLGKCAVSHARYAAKHSKVRPGEHHRRAVQLHRQESALKSGDGSDQKEKSRTS